MKFKIAKAQGRNLKNKRKLYPGGKGCFPHRIATMDINVSIAIECRVS